MECLTHSPAFNCITMAWVAGLGLAEGVPDEARALPVPGRRHDGRLVCLAQQNLGQLPHGQGHPRVGRAAVRMALLLRQRLAQEHLVP